MTVSPCSMYPSTNQKCSSTLWVPKTLICHSSLYLNVKSNNQIISNSWFEFMLRNFKAIYKFSLQYKPFFLKRTTMWPQRNIKMYFALVIIYSLRSFYHFDLNYYSQPPQLLRNYRTHDTLDFFLICDAAFREWSTLAI